MKDEIIIPTITKKFEKFDIESYNREKVNGQVRKTEGDDFKIFLDYSGGYGEGIYNNNSPFYTSKLFHPNGNIKLKSIAFNNGYASYGVCYHFDKAGNLVKEENTDEGYDFGWEDIFKYCKENNIVLDKGYPKRGGFKTDIRRYEKDGKKVWEIECCPNYETREHLRVIIDGKTGEEISKKKFEMPVL